MNTQKLEAFLGQIVSDMGATLSAAMVTIGEKRGLFRAMAANGPLTSAGLAAVTGCSERYVREWLNYQAAGGYVAYDPATQTYVLPPEQAAVLADPGSPFYMAGGFQTMLGAMRATERIAEHFLTGEGMGWHEHDSCVFCGTERFFATGYRAHLIQEWIPALEGVREKLERGARVADVGCGHGISTLVMAQAFPNSEFIGYDYHPASVQTARDRAAGFNMNGRVRFEQASAQAFPGGGFDLVTFFDCLHDMGDPAGAAARVRQSLKPDGTWMVVEPMAGDRAEENHNPVGRVYYGASTLLCTPCSLSQEGRAGLGAQAGEARLREVIAKGGFSRIRRAAATPFNLILEARP